MKKLLPISMIIITLVIISVSIVIAEEPKDVQGWRQAKWGMTGEEVLNAFKSEAVRRTESEIGKEEKDPNWPHYWPITIKNVIITSIYVGNKYDIYFEFDKKARCSYQLILKNQEVHTFENNIKESA